MSLHYQSVSLDSQDFVLKFWGEGDDVAGLPVGELELSRADGLAGFGDELVAVQHLVRVVRLLSCRRGTLRAVLQQSVPVPPPAYLSTALAGNIDGAEVPSNCRRNG